MNIKEYIKKHNINIPLEAAEEFERGFQFIFSMYTANVSVLEETRNEIKEKLEKLVTVFQTKHGMNPVVTDLKYNATGVLSWFAIDETDQENMVITPIFDNSYPIERISINAPDGKFKTETIIEDQVPLITEEVAQLELQAKFESYSKKQWVDVKDGLPVRFLGLLDNADEPFVVAQTRADGREFAFLLTEDLRLWKNAEIPCIKETGPYADWKIDAPVKYWDGPHERHGHYAGTDDNGNAMVWDFGGTSWTSQKRFPAPDFVELAED